jgi:hypothetical protein
VFGNECQRVCRRVREASLSTLLDTTTPTKRAVALSFAKRQGLIRRRVFIKRELGVVLIHRWGR